MDATELLVWGGLVHLVVDWLFQSEWIAEHKADLRHPAGLASRCASGGTTRFISPRSAPPP
jgi:hypothetical protein